eukprot:745729-Hanusia_phi.AAC.3
MESWIKSFCVITAAHPPSWMGMRRTRVHPLVLGCLLPDTESFSRKGQRGTLPPSGRFRLCSSARHLNEPASKEGKENLHRPTQLLEFRCQKISCAAPRSLSGAKLRVQSAAGRCSDRLTLFSHLSASSGTWRMFVV